METVDQEKEYEFPGDSVDMTEKHKIFSRKMKKDALKTLCRRYELGVGGTVPALQDKLKAFSEDRDQWTLLKAGARRTHKGPQRLPGSKKKTLKGAQLRREEWLGHLDVPEQYKTSTNVTIRKGRLVEWAREFRKQYPTRPYSPEPVTEDSSKPEVHPMFGGQYVVDTLDEILNRLPYQSPAPTPPPTDLAPALGPLPQPLFSSEQPSQLPASFLAPTSSRTIGVVEPEQHGSPSGSEPHLSTIENSLTGEVRTLKLVKGPVLRFTLAEAAVQDPNSRAISFAHDIDRLGHTWSDTYVYFDGKLCDVKINGRGIPVKYWSGIYKLHTPLRKQMNDWQWVAERYIESTPEDFWDEFSIDSDSNAKIRMNWKQITEALRQRRKQVDLANGVGFRQRRRKSGQGLVMSTV